MVIYYNLGRWRHGGLSSSYGGDVMAVYKDHMRIFKKEFFLSVEDWHEQVQINLGPNVGDITTEYKPPRRGRVMLIHIEAHEDKEYGALLQKT